MLPSLSLSLSTTVSFSISLIAPVQSTAAGRPPPTAMHTGQGLRLQLLHIENLTVATNHLGILATAAVASRFDYVAYDSSDTV